MTKFVTIFLSVLVSISAASKDTEQQTPKNTHEGSTVSSGKLGHSRRYLESNKPSARGNLRAASELFEVQEEVPTDQESNRHLQEAPAAYVTLVNNCGYDAHLALYYQSFNWIYGRGFYYLSGDGDSFTIAHQVSNPAIHIYGLHGATYKAVWDSPSSEYCFGPNDCFSPVNLGSLASGTVRYNLCGSNDPEVSVDLPPTPPPTPPPTAPPTPSPTPPPIPAVAPPVDSVKDQWIREHNLRRTDFFVTRNGRTDAPIQWSDSIASSATNYANKLASLSDCQIQHKYQGDDYGGENLGANWGGNKARTPKEVLTAWYDNEINLPGFFEKLHATQVVFRSSRYFGCGEASKTMSNGRQCFIQVCRYIAAGNCFPSGQNNWATDVLSDDAAKRCGGPQCPAEGCF